MTKIRNTALKAQTQLAPTQVPQTIPLSPNMLARVENIHKEFEQMQQRFQQEMNVMLSCFAEGVGMTNEQYFQLSADRKSIEIYVKPQTA